MGIAQDNASAEVDGEVEEGDLVGSVARYSGRHMPSRSGPKQRYKPSRMREQLLANFMYSEFS